MKVIVTILILLSVISTSYAAEGSFVSLIKRELEERDLGYWEVKEMYPGSKPFINYYEIYSYKTWEAWLSSDQWSLEMHLRLPLGVVYEFLQGNVRGPFAVRVCVYNRKNNDILGYTLAGGPAFVSIYNHPVYIKR